jgi:hypothetical protein
MTYPSSSISNFEEPSSPHERGGEDVALGPAAGTDKVWWRYLAIMLLVASLLLSAVWVSIATHRKKHGARVPYQVLLAHQLKKLELPTPSTVFLGDSSLGNAISVSRWEELSRDSALNLALTGSYGYASTYNFLRRVLERGRPKNVVIMQAVDLPTRNSSQLAFELTKPEGNAFERFAREWRETMNFTQVATVARAFFTPEGSKKAASASKRGVIVDDYIRQVSVQPRSRQRKRMDPQLISPRNMTYLADIAALCKQEGLNCMYVHGPLAQLTCDISGAYFKAAARAIQATGLTLVAEQPLCLEPSAVGDSVDHVRPNHKRRVTQQYYEMLRPLLK